MIRQGPLKYHVVHLVESLEVGGMENGIVNLANHMDRERFEVSICCLSHPGALAAKLADSGISHFSLGWLSGFCPRIIATLTRELTLRKADVPEPAVPVLVDEAGARALQLVAHAARAPDLHV